jgi:Flp pilus assembly protein TadD
MRDLDPLDQHRLRAAEGWLELGNAREALAELAGLSGTAHRHPDVLEVEWKLQAHQRNWQEALATAELLLQVDPDRPAGWIDRSYALHELKRTPEAFSALLPAAQRFDQVSVIPYNLACYTCCLGNLEAARTWLARAVRIGDREAIKRMALEDPDLEPLRSHVELL